MQHDGCHPRGPLEPSRYCRKLLQERWSPRRNCSFDSKVQPGVRRLLLLSLCLGGAGATLLSAAPGTLSSCQLSALLPAKITVLFAKQANDVHHSWLAGKRFWLSFYYKQRSQEIHSELCLIQAGFLGFCLFKIKRDWAETP